MKKTYHSALKEPLPIGYELDAWSDFYNLVFRKDLREISIQSPDHISAYFNKCDVFYTEPAWADGYEKFIERAGHEHSSFEEYLHHLYRIVAEIQKDKKPLWMLMGSHALNYLPDPDRIEKIKLHGYTTNLLGWNDKHEYLFTDNYDFIRQLAERYIRVGDFNCGYGNTGRIFQEAGKKFIMSDINAKCIYYIAKTLMGYEG